MKSCKLGPEDIFDLNFSTVALLSLEVSPVLAKLEQYLGWIHRIGIECWGMENKGFKVLMHSILIKLYLYLPINTKVHLREHNTVVSVF